MNKKHLASVVVWDSPLYFVLPRYRYIVTMFANLSLSVIFREMIVTLTYSTNDVAVWLCALSFSQAADNRIVAPPVAATNPAASVPPVPMPGTKLAGKLPYHSATSGPQCGGVGGAPLVSTTPKKPMISRGIPPPVPPNKPVVPPKKDAAYLRRTEPPVQPQATQESSNKFGKFQTAMLASSASNVGNVPVTSAASSAASQQATAATAPLIANVLAEEANRNP